VSAANDGGPAFPNNDAHGCAYSGMTLRDHFAGMALVGMINNTNAFENMSDKHVAENCWKAADAMIAARDGKEPA